MKHFSSSHRRHASLLLRFLGAALLLVLVVAGGAQAQTTISFLDGQVDATNYDTSAPNDPVTLSINTGTATLSGVLTGDGAVTKWGSGTLILSGLNTNTGATQIYEGTLEVSATGGLSLGAQSLQVGDRFWSGPARLVISGGTISDTNGILEGPARVASATMTSGVWQNTSALEIGRFSTGLLYLSGGSLTAGTTYLAEYGGFGMVSMSGGTWTDSSSLYVGNAGAGILNVSGGTLTSGSTYLGGSAGGRGRASLTGGTWTATTLTVGFAGSGLLEISGGSLTSGLIRVGSIANVSGTVNVSGGTWTVNDLFFLGSSGNGVLNLSGGSLTTTNVTLADSLGSLGKAVVSGGTWTVNGTLGVGRDGYGTLEVVGGSVHATGTISTSTRPSTGASQIIVSGGSLVGDADMIMGTNHTGILTVSGTGSVTVGAGGSGTITLGKGRRGVVNIGSPTLQTTGGTLLAGEINGYDNSLGDNGAVNFNQTNTFTASQLISGITVVNQFGSGTTRLTRANTYQSGTVIDNGTLELAFGGVSADILPSGSALSMTGGRLLLSGTGTQSLGSLKIGSYGSASIVLGANESLVVSSAPTFELLNSLNLNTAAGGANAGTATLGSGTLELPSLTAGDAINPAFTVTDAGGFGLATVNGANQVVRLTTSDLLPATGAVGTSHYRIDNNSGGSAAAGSSTLAVTASQSALSITVDTSAASGVLTLDPGVVVSSSVWNFGGTGAGANTYKITGGAGSGLTSDGTRLNAVQINNYGSGAVTLDTPVLDNNTTMLVIGGTGTVILNAANSFTGNTEVMGGVLEVAATGSIITPASSLGVAGTGGTATLNINGGSVMTTDGGLGTRAGGNGTVNITNGGSWTTDTFVLGALGAGTANVTSGTLTVNNTTTLGQSADSYGAINVSGSGTVVLGSTTQVGAAGTGVINVLEGGTITGSTLTLAADAGSVGIVNIGSATTPGKAGTFNVTSLIAGNGTATVNFNQTDDLTFTTGVSRNVNVSQNGPATTTMTFSKNGYTGSTTVNAGTLLVHGTAGRLGDVSIASGATFAGDAAVTITQDLSMRVQGILQVGEASPLNASTMSVTTSGVGSLIMGSTGAIAIDLFTGAGLGDNTATSGASDTLAVSGVLDATHGGTIILGNPQHMSGFAKGDVWNVVKLTSGSVIAGALAVDDKALGLGAGLAGYFDTSTGNYSIMDAATLAAQTSASSTGLPMANAEGQALLGATQTVTGDVNNHLFNLRSGGGEEDEDDGSISAALDYGVVMGQGDGPESPVARRIPRTRQWQVFATVNYGNVQLSPISNQAGVQIDAWASGLGIERHLSRHTTLGFAASFLQSHQSYTGGLGTVKLEGPALSAYVAYARRGFWGSLLYNFGVYDMDTTRNPGAGFPAANGNTTTYTHAIQYNTGWNFRFQNNTLVTGPFAGIDYLYGSVDSYSETGGGLAALSYARQSFQSLVTRVGWALSKKLHTDWADITPQLRLSYERQNLHNNGTSVSLINAPFTAAGGNQTPGQDYMVVGGGVNFQFTPEFSLLLSYQTQIFRNNLEAHFASVRLGYRF
ncbi:autotransporter domain-containing protein [Prosthecobacter sp.]|uniref:autotransporter domain-containing protein n=1 Tax=Prosthecobacter sp. TaxID=1965333 RepID=UPI003784469B